MLGGTRSYELSRRLVDYGHQVNMVTSWREPGRGKDWFRTDEDGVDVHWLPVEYGNEMSYAKRVRAFARFAVGASRRAASLDADVVFCHEYASHHRFARRLRVAETKMPDGV